MELFDRIVTYCILFSFNVWHCRVLRHPAYFGWFYWSIGTQLLLCNPLCFLAYIAASWSFFSKRIPYEESLLAEFYPLTYSDYCKKTIIGIPFITNTDHVKAE
jgi:protein-S-isoprenylcysteine O-methyltransferase Ste14